VTDSTRRERGPVPGGPRPYSRRRRPGPLGPRSSGRAATIVPACAGSPTRRPQAPRRQKLVLAHEAQHALAADGQAPMRQPRPHPAIAFAMERRRREDSRIAARIAPSRIIAFGPRLPGTGGTLGGPAAAA